MVNLKCVVLGLVLATAMVHAEPVLYSGSAEDSKLGRLSFTVTEVGEPAIMPFRLSVSVLCTNGVAKVTRIKPSAGVILKNEAICEFRKQEFNKTTKVLTLHFSTSEFTTGQARCDADWAQDFNLKALCPESSDSGWARPK